MTDQPTLRDMLANAIAKSILSQDDERDFDLPDDLKVGWLDQGEVDFGLVADAAMAAMPKPDALERDTNTPARTAYEASKTDEALAKWRDIESDPLPRDATVICVYTATEQNKTFQGKRDVLPFYIDENGVVCDCGEWKPELTIASGNWKITHWQPFPELPLAPKGDV